MIFAVAVTAAVATFILTLLLVFNLMRHATNPNYFKLWRGRKNHIYFKKEWEPPFWYYLVWERRDFKGSTYGVTREFSFDVGYYSYLTEFFSRRIYGIEVGK